MNDCSICRTVSLTSAVLIAFTLGGCSPQQYASTSPAYHEFDQWEDYEHQRVRVAKGETLTVKLPTTNGGTFVWRLAGEHNGGEQLQVVTRAERTSPTGEPAYGDDPVADVFAFKATEEGLATLEFIYDGGPGTPESKRSRVTVDVIVFDAYKMVRAQEAERVAKAKAEAEAQAIAQAAFEAELQAQESAEAMSAADAAEFVEFEISAEAEMHAEASDDIDVEGEVEEVVVVDTADEVE